MANKQIVCWRVTVVRPGAGGAQVVLPIARDKLQASKRAAYMLGLSWKESAKYMVVRGPIKAQARQIREWNETYPQWSTERENPSSASLRSAPSHQGEGFGRGRRIAASASPPRNDREEKRTSTACPYSEKQRSEADKHGLSLQRETEG